MRRAMAAQALWRPATNNGCKGLGQPSRPTDGCAHRWYLLVAYRVMRVLGVAGRCLPNPELAMLALVRLDDPVTAVRGTAVTIPGVAFASGYFIGGRPAWQHDGEADVDLEFQKTRRTSAG